MRRGRGPYYYRCVRVDGRPACQYLGKGEAGRLAAESDRVERLERQAARSAWDTTFAGAEKARVSVKELAEGCDLMVRTYLVAAGFHRYGGEWRMRDGRRHRETEC
jgi:hypothetical protein